MLVHLFISEFILIHITNIMDAVRIILVLLPVHRNIKLNFIPIILLDRGNVLWVLFIHVRERKLVIRYKSLVDIRSFHIRVYPKSAGLSQVNEGRWNTQRRNAIVVLLLQVASTIHFLVLVWSFIVALQYLIRGQRLLRCLLIGLFIFLLEIRVTVCKIQIYFILSDLIEIRSIRIVHHLIYSNVYLGFLPYGLLQRRVHGRWHIVLPTDRRINLLRNLVVEILGLVCMRVLLY